MFGAHFNGDSGEAGFYLRNLNLFVLPLVAWFLIRTLHPESRVTRLLPVPFVVGALAANIWSGEATEVLLAPHLPVVLWLIVVAFPPRSSTSSDRIHAP